jgi:Arc/MetJ-type ribon-helix-helix transcriptional regulator
MTFSNLSEIVGELRMDGERISLRLEPEDLELLDAFIEKHPEYSNRSNFARVALRSFIENLEGQDTATPKNHSKKNMVTVEVPRMVHETIMDSVRAGMYNSPEDAVVECLRKHYIKTEETLEAIKRAKLEAIKNTVQVL